MKTGKILAIFGLIVSTFAVFVRIMTPTTVQFIVEGSVIELNRIPDIYTSVDMTVTGISCFAMGSSLVYLWFVGKNEPVRAGTSSLRRSWDELLDRLSNPDEQKTVRFIVEEGAPSFKVSWWTKVVTQKVRSAFFSTGLRRGEFWRGEDAV